MYDVFGIGNPLIDALIKVDDSHIIDLGLNKGQFHLVDDSKNKEAMKYFKNHDVVYLPAGDVINTLIGIASLGGESLFFGKVGVDDKGFIIEESLKKKNIHPILIKEGNTGSCITLITPDKERTMLTNLGAAITLREDELITKDIKDSKILYVTGYILEDPNLRKMAIKGLKEAKMHNKTIAIDVSDPGLVKRCKKDLLEIIKEYADMIFANEEEAKALTGMEPEEAVHALTDMVDIAVVKIGKEGALVKKDELIKVPGLVVKAVDTTGAGDNFAAGFLYGFSQGYSLEDCAKLANYLASRIVMKMGGSHSEKFDPKKILTLAQ